MADILPSYTWSGDVARFRSTVTGRFVARRDIISLLDAQINSAETRLGNLVTALYEGNLSASTWQSVMRDELRRLHLQNGALGAGGFDRLTAREYGRAGALLREDYARLTQLAHDIANGEVTLPQALNRVRGYVGSARLNYYAADRDAAQQTGRRYEERRLLHASESCGDCISYAAMGWQPEGTLPLPCEGSACTKYCRCTMERREVTA